MIIIVLLLLGDNNINISPLAVSGSLPAAAWRGRGQTPPGVGAHQSQTRNYFPAALHWTVSVGNHWEEVLVIPVANNRFMVTK